MAFDLSSLADKDLPRAPKKCDNCGARSTEGEPGTDDHQHMWFCDACWTKWNLDDYHLKEEGYMFRVFSSFGEPWKVNCTMAVRRRPDKSASAVGTLLAGDIVGISQVAGDWAELSQDSEMRLLENRDKLGPATGKLEQWEVESSSILVKSKRWEKWATVKQKDPTCKAWVQVRDPRFGEMLELADFDLAEGLSHKTTLMSIRREEFYNAILELHYKRVYQEHWHHLWEVNCSKMPSSDTLLPRLLDTNTLVLHSEHDGELGGGVIMREVSFPTSSSAASATIKVCYIDTLVSTVGSHSGVLMFDAIESMCDSRGWDCIAVHSYTLKETATFWQQRGFLEYELSIEQHCTSFKARMLKLTGKRCTLSKFQSELPQSNGNRPLYIFHGRRKVFPEISYPNADVLY